MTQYPEPVVGLFIKNNQGKSLLAKSYKWAKGKMWVVPGGRIEWGEKIAEAAQREALEEVGLKVKFIKVFAVFDAIYPKNFHKKKHFIFLECQCLVDDNQTAKIDNREIQKAHWFSQKDIKELELESFTRKAIP